MQFCDGSVAGAYYARTPYPDELFDVLESVITKRPSRVLEFGRGVAVPFAQSMDDYVESFHSSNGLSRERMEPASAQEFDDSVRRIAGPYAEGGRVNGQVVGTLVWGRVARMGWQGWRWSED